MVFLDGTLGIAIGILAGLVLLRYSGLMDKIIVPAGFIAAGVMFYFIDVATSLGVTDMLGETATVWLSFIWQLLALIFILIGALWAVVAFITKPKSKRR
ncbi:MAG: hypothetical protein J4445_01735 [DPANN group archaeon]|nr:hypothetical protein [DPANN group archaeon]